MGSPVFCVKSSMGRQPDNDPVIDAEDSGTYDVRGIRGRKLDSAEIELIVRCVRELQPRVSYRERGDERLLKWLLGLVSALILAFVIGAVGVYGIVEGHDATVKSINSRLDRIEDRLDGRSGGGPNAPNAR
jgi:hypothetical protein